MTSAGLGVFHFPHEDYHFFDLALNIYIRPCHPVTYIITNQSDTTSINDKLHLVLINLRSSLKEADGRNP